MPANKKSPYRNRLQPLFTNGSIFTDWQMGRLVAQQLHLAQEERWADFLTWVVMPDHMHCLVQIRDKTLAELMCRIKSRSSLAVNQALGRSGRLWQKGYHDRAVRREEDAKNLARYVVANPIRAGLVAAAEGCVRLRSSRENDPSNRS
ncbi:transposase [Pseudomonas sp. FP603]|uniref:REP-associated tyrosine transposase n=1 Tax=Pseudomonas sp. FP603 TaxID=2954097 RepID=UPI00351E9646